MRVRVWRISLATRAADAFDGEGAALYGGRWNPKGVARRPVPMVAIHAEIPEPIEPVVIGARELPSNWRSRRPADSTRAIGAAWTATARSAVMSVPSVVIPRERNYLLNPAHPDFRKIRIGKPEPFSFDERMWKPE